MVAGKRNIHTCVHVHIAADSELTHMQSTMIDATIRLLHGAAAFLSNVIPSNQEHNVHVCETIAAHIHFPFQMLSCQTTLVIFIALA